MPKLNRSIKNSLLVVATASLLFSAKPAQALDIGALLSGMAQEIGLSKQYISSFIDKIVGIFPDNIAAAIRGDVTGEDVVGELGLPDLQKSEEKITQTLKKEKKLGELETTVDLVKANVIEAHANSIVSQEGQKNSMQATQRVQESVAASNKLATEANSAQVTQEVMKKIAMQNEQLTGVMSEIHGSMEGLNVNTAHSNIIQAELARKEIEKKAEKQAEERNTNLTEMRLIKMFQGYAGGE